MDTDTDNQQMGYDEIKRELRRAESLIREGDLAGANAAIRAMAGRGLTGADLSDRLSKDSLRKLRAYARKNR